MNSLNWSCSLPSYYSQAGISSRVLESKSEDNEESKDDDYNPDIESENEDDNNNNDDKSGLIYDFSFINNSDNNFRVSLPTEVNRLSVSATANAVIDGFSSMIIQDQRFSTDFKSHFIQYGYIEDD